MKKFNSTTYKTNLNVVQESQIHTPKAISYNVVFVSTQSQLHLKHTSISLKTNDHTIIYIT